MTVTRSPIRSVFAPVVWAATAIRTGGSAPPADNLLFSDTNPADLLTNEAGDQFLEQDQL